VAKAAKKIWRASGESVGSAIENRPYRKKASAVMAKNQPARGGISGEAGVMASSAGEAAAIISKMAGVSRRWRGIGAQATKAESNLEKRMRQHLKRHPKKSRSKTRCALALLVKRK
jgi:hypothetical protein